MEEAKTILANAKALTELKLGDMDIHQIIGLLGDPNVHQVSKYWPWNI